MRITGRTKELARTLAVFAAACLALWALRLFAAEPYTVASPLLAGDRVLVDKTAYGVRLPAWPPFGGKRLWYAPPRRGDMMAFRNPADSCGGAGRKDVRLARCLALPGDTVRLTPLLRPATRDGKGAMPFVVPAKGRRVTVTRWNARLLCSAINRHEPCHCAETRGDTLLVDGHTAEYVVFAQDYFWAYSGRPGNTGDSRLYGLVPRSHLIGRARLILYSAAPGGPAAGRLRPERTLARISGDAK